jgi:hypothetical protein
MPCALQYLQYEDMSRVQIGSCTVEVVMPLWWLLYPLMQLQLNYKPN